MSKRIPSIHLNRRTLSRVVIDQHYKEKHSDVNDEIILNLISQLSEEVIYDKMAVKKTVGCCKKKALAKKIGTDDAVISKILHYNIDEFTIDRLVKFLAALYPGAEVKIEVAS